jgi:hypothetical protein
METIQTIQGTVNIELDYPTAELFKFFMANYENIKTLKDSGAFDFKSKTVQLHIDGVGTIKAVDVTLRCL